MIFSLENKVETLIFSWVEAWVLNQQQTYTESERERGAKWAARRVGEKYSTSTSTATARHTSDRRRQRQRNKLNPICALCGKVSLATLNFNESNFQLIEKCSWARLKNIQMPIFERERESVKRKRHTEPAAVAAAERRSFPVVLLCCALFFPLFVLIVRLAA